MKFYRDDGRRQLVRWYVVEDHVPCMPIPTAFLGGGFTSKGTLSNAPEGGVGEDSPTWRWVRNQPKQWTKIGDHFCGSPEQWLEGSLVGRDPPLEWTEFGFSTCCEGVIMTQTADRIVKFGASPGALEDSKLWQPGTGGVACDDSFEAQGLLSLILAGLPGGSGTHLQNTTTPDRPAFLLESVLIKPGLTDPICRMTMDAPYGGRPTLHFQWFGTNGPPILRWQGEGAHEGQAYGGRFAGGHLIDPVAKVPLADVQGAGSAAGMDATDFETAGAVAAHVAQPNPHAQYLTEAQGDAAYEPVGTANVVMATHVMQADPHTQYITQVVADARYDPAGAAVALMNDHLSQADPHAQYLTEERGDARYAPIGTVPSVPGALLASLYVENDETVFSEQNPVSLQTPDRVEFTLAEEAVVNIHYTASGWAGGAAGTSGNWLFIDNAQEVSPTNVSYPDPGFILPNHLVYQVLLPAGPHSIEVRHTAHNTQGSHWLKRLLRVEVAV